VIIDRLRGCDHPRDLRIDLRLSANLSGAENKCRERDAGDQGVTSRKVDFHPPTTHKIRGGEKAFPKKVWERGKELGIKKEASELDRFESLFRIIS